MINANELRITNNVYDNGKICTIESINAFADGEADVYLVETGNAGMFIDPIPLTEDVLFKCGFDKNDNMFTDNKLVGIEIYDEDLHFRVLCGNYCLCVINNLHQLQNLYFALTGEELNIKL